VFAELTFWLAAEDGIQRIHTAEFQGIFSPTPLLAKQYPDRVSTCTYLWMFCICKYIYDKFPAICVPVPYIKYCLKNFDCGEKFRYKIFFATTRRKLSQTFTKTSWHSYLYKKLTCKTSLKFEEFFSTKFSFRGILCNSRAGIYNEGRTLKVEPLR
jgi:hypothetical protein